MAIEKAFASRLEVHTQDRPIREAARVGGFTHTGTALEWRGGRETVRIERRLYVTSGAAWRDAWTGAEHEGGRWITAPAPLDTIPACLRAGGPVDPFGRMASLGSPENSGE